MDGVAISIIGRPRPLPGHDTPNPAHNTYTLKCEEPLNLPYYIPLLPSITSDCCRLDDYVSLHYLLKHMAHLVQAAVWTAGLDDRLTDSGLISFQLCKAYAPPVGVKGQISTVCLYTAGGNLASKDNFILFYLDRFDGGTVFRCIMISPGKIFPGRIEGEGEIRFQQLRP